MASDFAAFNPYSSPPPDSYSPRSSERPGWLTAIIVIAIILGVFGLLIGVVGLGSTIFGQQMQAAMAPRPNPGITPEMQKAMDQFQKEIQAITDRYFVPLLLSSLLRVVVASLLVYGGIQALSLKANGRTVLLAAFATGLVFEVFTGVLQSFMNIEMNAAMNAYFEGIVGAMPAQGPGSEVMLSIMRMSMVFGYIFQYFTTFAKIAFYVFGLVYLRRPQIVALFRNSATGPAPASQ